MLAEPDGRKPVLSLHQRILNELEAEILTGRWPPGHRVPPEKDLCLHYGCSRMTVNKVLTQLARAGLVMRRRRSGSVVLSQQAESAILQIYDIREEVKALDRPYCHSILERTVRKPDRNEQNLFNISGRHQVKHLICLHFAGATPFCLEERLISLQVVPEAEDEDFTDLPPGPWLIDHVPWSAGEHRIAARAADEKAAAHLCLPVGTPVMVVERQTWRFEQSVTHVRLTYPGESHTLTARFTPSQTA
ncbi:MAG: histidine utilization repressor [Neorhizobium sp.]|nr:histidine utilization repressor [Neorhizobium sp.]